MFNKDKYIVTAKLKNDKHVVLDEPNYVDMSIAYRFMTDREIKGMNLENHKLGFWHIAPIYKTIEDGATISFTVIEGTPIILHKFNGIQ